MTEIACPGKTVTRNEDGLDNTRKRMGTEQTVCCSGRWPVMSRDGSLVPSGWNTGTKDWVAMKCLNMVGPQIRKLRYVCGWSQNKLATKLQILGWDIDRGGVAKIESRLVHVDDYELLYFSEVFEVDLMDLFPKIDPSKPLHDVVTQSMRRTPAKSAMLPALRALGAVGRLGNPSHKPGQLVPVREHSRR